MVLIIIGAQDNIQTIAIVSVPLRGLWFLSINDRVNEEYGRIFVSVPLRGLWFLSDDE